jgi:hypothetical protein
MIFDFFVFLRNLFFLFKKFHFVANFVKNLLASEGFLSSLQFGFTALLTLLVATGISLYDSKKDAEYQIDKTIISKILDLKWLLFAVVFASILILLFNNNFAKANFLVNFFIFLALTFPYFYLVYINYKVIVGLTNIKQVRQEYLFKNQSGEVLDFWEEYFKRLENQKKNETSKLKQREFYKFREEESGYIQLFFKIIHKLDFKKDTEFGAQMIEIFLKGFENINFEIFFYERWILDKLLVWHKQAWENYYEDCITLRQNSYLQSELMNLINKILEKSTQSNGMIFSNLTKKINKHLEDNWKLVIKNKFCYINDFDFHNIILDNLYKSNFLDKIKNDNSDYYFPQNWIITNPKNTINSCWIQILFRRWLPEKINRGNLTNDFEEETKNQIKAVLQVFFRKINYDWLVEVILYWIIFFINDVPTKDAKNRLRILKLYG